MTCYNHPGMGTVDVCGNCGKECCAACITLVSDRAVCRDCAIVLRSQQPPEPAEMTPERREHPEAKAPAVAPTSLQAINVQSLVPVPAKSSAMVPAMPPSPQAVNDPGAGGRREKESLLSAALSLILPGVGQVFNGQIVKGVILAAVLISGRWLPSWC